jgi:hypothetical protein
MGDVNEDDQGEIFDENKWGEEDKEEEEEGEDQSVSVFYLIKIKFSF